MNVGGPLVVSHWDMEMKLPCVSVVGPAGGSLTINQEPASEAGGFVACRNINHQTHEVAAPRRIVGYEQDIFPWLLALRLSPTVVALKHRDHELGRAIDDLGKWTVYGFHGLHHNLRKLGMGHKVQQRLDVTGSSRIKVCDKWRLKHLDSHMWQHLFRDGLRVVKP